VQPFLVKKSASMQGFIVSDFEDKHAEGIKKTPAPLVGPLGTWTKGRNH
jgi:NADPH-dependent curcumin reductase CurA